MQPVFFQGAGENCVCVCACTPLSRTERDTSASEGKDRKSVPFTNLDALHETKGRGTQKASSEQKLANLPRWPHYFRRTLAEFKKRKQTPKGTENLLGKGVLQQTVTLMTPAPREPLNLCP